MERKEERRVERRGEEREERQGKVRRTGEDGARGRGEEIMGKEKTRGEKGGEVTKRGEERRGEVWIAEEMDSCA